MKVLIFNPSYPPVQCGVGAYTRGLAEALVLAGHEVTVVTAAIEPPPSGTSRVLALLEEWDIRSFLCSWPRFARPRPDVVISSFPAIVPGRYSRLLYLIPLLARISLGWPRTVFIVHEFIRIGEPERRWLGLALRAADRIVAVTEAERDAVVARYPSVSARTVVRHNPPTVPVVPEDARADALTRAQIDSQGRPVIAFIGLLRSATKGFEDLLQALLHSDALLLATGSLDPNDEYQAHLAAEIERLGLASRVRWLGFLDDDEAARMLRVADAVVLPYRGGAESGYTSMLAALVNGAAVITTSGPQTPSWLRDGETALLVEPNDPSALAAAIDRLLADDSLATRIRDGACHLPFGWSELIEAVTAPKRGLSA